MSNERLSVIYDGDCGFCQASLRKVRALDRHGTLEYIDFHDKAVIASRFPQLAGADFEKAMYVVTPKGKSYRGFHAFRRLAWNFTWTRFVAPLLYFPGVAFVGERVYAWVAANRYRLPSGGEGTSCSLPPRRDSK